MIYPVSTLATQREGEIIYRASGVVLRVDSGAAHLVAPGARSRAGGYHYPSGRGGGVFGGPVLALAKVIGGVMSPAAGAELGALCLDSQEAVALRDCLGAMGYPQPPTPLGAGNSTASGTTTNTMEQRRPKAMGMRFCWVRDRVDQGQSRVCWELGKTNYGDFCTKHHPATPHKQVRPTHMFVGGLPPANLQGCVRVMTGIQVVW